MVWTWLCLLAAVLLPGQVMPGVSLRDVSSHLGDYRLPKDLEPVGYSLQLQPHLEDGGFSGEVWINVTCLHGTSTVVMHAHEDLNVTAVSVFVNPQSSSVALGRQVEVRHVERDVEKQWLIVMLEERLRKQDSYRLHLVFHGSLDGEQTEGMYRRMMLDPVSNKTRWYVDTNMKMDSARRIFPCFDEPQFKAVFDVKVATTGRQHVFSNMPLADIVDMPGRYGWYWKNFERSPPISTMSFGLFMFDFEHYSLSKGVLHVLGRTAMKTDIEKVLESLDRVYEFFVEYLGIDNPLPKLDMVIVPGNVRKQITGSFGLITINEDHVKEAASVMESVAYLTVGQWVHHLMSPQWWGELDVSTGINWHLSYTFLEKGNYLNYWEQRSMYYEYAKMEPYKGLGSLRDDVNFSRASWFVRMIQYALTEETFMTGLRKFLHMRLYETFSEHDLWTALTEEAWTQGTLPRSILVEEAAKSWLSKDRCPVVTVTRDYSHNSATVEQHVFLRNKFYRLPDTESLLWYVPIMYLTPRDLNVSAVRPAAWMRNQREVSVSGLPEPSEFIIINPAEIGMFMVNYDATNWALLSDALQRRSLLPVAVRAKLVHDAWNLAFAGELSFNSAMNVTLFLKHETEYVVWEVMLTMVDHVGRFLDGTRAADKLKRYFVQLASEAMKRMGSSRWAHSDKRNTYDMVKYFVRKATSKKPTQRQRALFDAWARGNADSSPKIVEAICLMLKHGTVEEFERGLHRVMEVLKMRQDKWTPGLLRLVSNCAKQQEKVDRLLNVAFLGHNTGFTDRDRTFIVGQLSGFYAGYRGMFFFLRDNWDALRQALEDKPDLWLDLVDDAMTIFKSEEELKMVARMFADKRTELGNAAPLVQAGLEEMTANVQWTQANVPALEHWLDQHLLSEDKQE